MRRALPIPNPGRVPVHRLNRAEYTNAIRDLLGLEIDGRAVLSTDDSEQEGFDNVASVLTVSPALLENYLSAARMISRLAVGDTTRRPMVDVFKVERDFVQDERMSEDLPFGSRGGIAVDYQFPVDGEYLIKLELKRQLYDYLVGMGEPHQVDIRLDGALLKRFTIGGEGKGMTTPENFAGNTPGDPGVGTLHAHRRSGPRGSRAGESRPAQRWRLVRQAAVGTRRRAAAAANRIRTHDQRALFRLSGAEDRLDRWPVQRARARASRPPAARSSCARRKMRRPKSRVRARFFRRLRRARIAARSPNRRPACFSTSTKRDEPRKNSFDAGIQRGLERVLAAPSFIFRIKSNSSDDIDLASKLSVLPLEQHS